MPQAKVAIRRDPVVNDPLKRLKPLDDQGFQCRDTGFCGSDRRRSGDLSIFSRTLYQLSYRAVSENRCPATLTGLEPATSAVTGRRANQLRYRALHAAVPNRHEEKLYQSLSDSATLKSVEVSTPNGIRTRAAAVKGRCPRPLDDGGPKSQGEDCSFPPGEPVRV